MDRSLGEGQVLAGGQLLLHDLEGHGGPGAVLDEGHGAVLEVPLGEVVDELPHEGVDVRVIGGGSQHQLPVAEGVGDGQGHIGPGQVMDHYLGAAALAKLVRQQLHRLAGMAVDGGVGDDDALGLHGIGSPGLIELDVVPKILVEDGAVERADGGDVQARRLLEEVHGLGAVLAHDADVVPAGLVVPGLGAVEGPELAEGVRGEEDLVGAVVGHHDLGPMDHGREDEGEGVAAQSEGAAVLGHLPVLHEIGPEEVVHHGEGLGGRHHGGLGVGLQEAVDIGGMVRLHVLDDEVVGLAASERVLQIVQPLMGEMLVHGVHDGHLLVQNNVGVVTHAVGDLVLALEQVHLVIVHAHVQNIACNLHSHAPS